MDFLLMHLPQMPEFRTVLFLLVCRTQLIDLSLVSFFSQTTGCLCSLFQPLKSLTVVATELLECVFLIIDICKMSQRTNAFSHIHRFVEITCRRIMTAKLEAHP